MISIAIQHWETDRYRAWKRDLVIATLAQAKIDCEVSSLVDGHGKGRRRMTVHARKGSHDVLKVGFAAAYSHDVVPIDHRKFQFRDHLTNQRFLPRHLFQYGIKALKDLLI